MMVHRYRPTYFSGFEDEEAEANTLDELLAIPWVWSWAEFPNFHRYSLSEHRLMAELDDGYKWWVVAMLDGDDGFGLPRWEAKP